MGCQATHRMWGVDVGDTRAAPTTMGSLQSLMTKVTESGCESDETVEGMKQHWAVG